MSDHISNETLEAFNFVRERHLGRSLVTYETLLARNDRDALRQVQRAVATGIVRWLYRQNEFAIAAFRAAMNLSYAQNNGLWQEFRRAVWDDMNAAAWLARWDCWTADSHLWATALIEVHSILNISPSLSEYER